MKATLSLLIIDFSAPFYSLNKSAAPPPQLMRQYSSLTVENFFLSLEPEYDSCS